MDLKKLIKALNLKPHPSEGGYYLETYRSDENISGKYLPRRYKGKRCISTAIYYLLTPSTFSEMHSLISDEIFHFYLGDPVEMLNLYPDGSGKIITIGNNIEKAMRPQVIVKKGVWQGARLVSGGKFAIMGTTVAPGFEFKDYKSGDRKTLIKIYPKYKKFIIALTKE
ncbi:cupin domain-containing protein [Candidatus Desantisbacteria bacterium]|nr:cupin domain-containing protein [Candidatus Desantisbacteria bacterium]